VYIIIHFNFTVWTGRIVLSLFAYALWCLCNKFGIFQLILIILSLPHSEMNNRISWYKINCLSPHIYCLDQSVCRPLRTYTCFWVMPHVSPINASLTCCLLFYLAVADVNFALCGDCLASTAVRKISMLKLNHWPKICLFIVIKQN